MTIQCGSTDDSYHRGTGAETRMAATRWLLGIGLHKLYFYLQPACQMHPYFHQLQCSCDNFIPGQQTRILLYCISSWENIQQTRAGDQLCGFTLGC